MLDDQNRIKQLDTFDALTLAANTPDQLRHGFSIPKQSVKREIRNVVYCGMGGSGLQAEFIKTWPGLDVPFVLHRDYGLPDFVDEHTLVLAASYSGNTEESLSSLEVAREKGAYIAVMAGGGKMKELAEEHGDVFGVIPKAVQPRMAVFHSFRLLVEMLIAFGLVDTAKLEELDDAASFLDKVKEPWLKDVPTADNPAKQLGEKLVGKTPIFYAASHVAGAAYKWKIGVNENAKNTAWYNVYPEFNHNEFMGWTSHPVEKPFAVVDLRTSYDHDRIEQRFDLSDRMLSGMRPHAITVEAQGDSLLQQLLYLVLFGDFATIYMGLLNGVDPSPVSLIEKFKKELG